VPAELTLDLGGGAPAGRYLSFGLCHDSSLTFALWLPYMMGGRRRVKKRGVEIQGAAVE
jgi:hypothetical protein